MFPVRYGLNSYINLLRNSVFKELNIVPLFVCQSAIRSTYAGRFFRMFPAEVMTYLGFAPYMTFIV
jgi:hypothetical protein